MINIERTQKLDCLLVKRHGSLATETTLLQNVFFEILLMGRNPAIATWDVKD